MSEKRMELIETAIRLFNQYGFHGTGIDRIAEEACVSKKTMYHHFRTKDELILAALRHQDGLFRNKFMKEVRQSSDDPRQRLLNIFDVAREWFTNETFFGCMFVNAIGEYSDSNTVIRGVCKENKRLILDFIRSLAQDAGVVHAEPLAETLALMLEGAIVTAQIAENPDAACTAKRAATVVVDAALSASAA